MDGTGDVSYINIADKWEENGKKILLRAREVAKLSEISFRTKLVFSNEARIYKSALNQINKFRADLIVMGTHGIKGIE